MSRCESIEVETSPKLVWNEETWGPMVLPGNGTEVDPDAVPVGMYVDHRDFLREFDFKIKEDIGMVPIYRMKSFDYHEEVHIVKINTVPICDHHFFPTRPAPSHSR